ncbi:type II secretion system protein [Botrimarina hoheduenensis]|uniref:Type II secretion system protein G n=1 Tax=Botrimarina hoheduenensis TaxID=2528000 RepID=A0A5C5W9A5_9BACT|nr:prepilin-type N-terminal cleavage/methylation domain-containing protein [Botrimarina hoheduenensis]TWT46775.1 Type II secretion system protein G precursor [Botrimarina hoheduenensis]
MRPCLKPIRPAFTIVELVTVMLVIGILVGVAVPKILSGNKDAAIEATRQHLKTIALAAEMYYSDHGRWPDGDAHGVMPVDFKDYLRPNLFAVNCPLGGLYDWNENFNSVTASIDIRDPATGSGQWRKLDQRIDDGVLATGDLVQEGWRLRWILER